MRVHALQHDTVDALCWRHLGRTAGVVEAVLEINPGLAAHGVILPHGLAVELPNLSAAAAVPMITPTVKLWS